MIHTTSKIDTTSTQPLKKQRIDSNDERLDLPKEKEEQANLSASPEPSAVPLSLGTFDPKMIEAFVLQSEQSNSDIYPIVELENLDETVKYEDSRFTDHKINPIVGLTPPNASELMPFTTALAQDSDYESEEYDDEESDEDEFAFKERINFSQFELLEWMANKLNHGKPVDRVSLRVKAPPNAAKKLKMYLWMNGPIRFLQKYVYSGYREHTLGEILATFSFPLPQNLVSRSNTDELIEMVKVAIRYTIMPRRRLPDPFTIDSLTDAIKNANNIIVLTGAGISTSLGIPDFRSKSGLYNKLSYLGLSDPQEVFNLRLFQSDPSIFYSIAKEILPVTQKFSPTHSFIKLLQDKGKLLRNYTQNIDNLEHYAGVDKEKLIQCHGSFATATCQTCGYTVNGEDIFENIRNASIPKCPLCSSAVKPRKRRANRDDSDSEDEDPIYGVMKPDITFFGEPLPDKFESTLIGGDAEICDLLICIGTSLKVSPVSETVRIIPPNVPQVYISKTPISHNEFDLNLLGYCDDIIEHLIQKLGWKMNHPMLKNKPYDGQIDYNEEDATYTYERESS